MAYSLAALAAVAFAFGTVLQQKGTLQTSSGENDPRFLVEIFHKPVWLAGMISQAAGWILQAGALDRGPLVVVQSLTAMSLVIALPLGIWLTKQHIGPREWLGALAVLVGIMFFLWAGAPSGGTNHPSASVVVGGLPRHVGPRRCLGCFRNQDEGCIEGPPVRQRCRFRLRAPGRRDQDLRRRAGPWSTVTSRRLVGLRPRGLGRRRVRPPAGGAQDRRARTCDGVEQRRDALLQCDLGDRRLRRKALGQRRRPCRVGGSSAC